VELYADLPQDEYEDVGDAIRDAILADPEARSQAVCRVLDELDGVAVERILFPGWTLVGYTLPSWVINRSVGHTLALEMLPPRHAGRRKEGVSPDDRGWRAFVVRDREVLVGPVFQLFYSGSQVDEVGAPSQAALDLAAQLAGGANPNRRWRDPAWPNASLMMCGEVNVIYSPKTLVRDMPVVRDTVVRSHHEPGPQAELARRHAAETASSVADAAERRAAHDREHARAVDEGRRLAAEP
jgi:hypothetical protein